MDHSHALNQKSTTDRLVYFRFATRLLSAVSTPLAARAAARVFITPPRPRAPQREADWAKTARRMQIPHNGGFLDGWEWGTGPRTALLVHGWGGRGLQLGAFAEPLADRGWRVVTFDGPGHGASSQRTSSMPELAAAIAAVARHLGGVDAVVSHSLGATAVILTLSRGQLDPLRVVALASPSSFAAMAARFSQLSGFSPAVVERMRLLIEDRFQFSWETSDPLLMARDQVSPLLVIHDREDREVPWEEGAALAAAWPDARIESFSGLGHRRLLRDPRVIDAAISFLDETASTVTDRAQNAASCAALCSN